jgi:O-antigen biosynthesis protein
VLKSLTWRYRRIRSVAQRLRTSLALRGWRGTLARVSQEFQRRSAADDALRLVPLDDPFLPFELRTSEAPVVSVVIPVHGKINYTIACLRSIERAPSALPFEVIVVDDASPDDTLRALADVAGLRVLRNEKNLGFVGSCNAGAAIARGDYLFFLNNDTQVTPGSTDELVHFLEAHPHVGIVGSRLVYPDGRLQESGAWVFADGSAWNIGRFESRDTPAYRYAREVDYVSGAALMISRRLFAALGGFDPRFAPGYYEDTDLAFAVRDAGFSVWVVPSSTVVHAEGISSAGAEAGGMKRFQEINRGVFAEKWRMALTQQPLPGTPLIEAAARRSRGTVLVVDASSPDETRDSGSVRLIAMMRLLLQDGWHVVFIPDDGHADERTVQVLGRMGVELQEGGGSRVNEWLRANGRSLHAAILARYTVASAYLSLVRQLAPSARVIFDTVDLHFLREERAAHQAASASLARRAEITRREELELVGSADITWVVSPYERDLLAELAPAAQVDILSNIHRIHKRGRGFEGRRHMLFVGGYGHPPNADAMRWMADELLPSLHRVDPSLQILVAGAIPETSRRSFAAAGLTMLGRVDDLGPLMDQCLVSIAPLRFGAGVKGKVNMAMSYGLPVIGTPIAVEGMQLRPEHDVFVAEDAEAFSRTYFRLACDPALWTAVSDRSQQHVATHFSAEAALQALRRAMGSTPEAAATGAGMP